MIEISCWSRAAWQEILGLEAACRQEEKALAKTKQEIAQSDGERRHLQQQLDDSQTLLLRLRDEYGTLQRENVFLQRPGGGVQHVGLRHERHRSTNEAEVLQRLLEEYQRDCQARSCYIWPLKGLGR